MSQFFEAEKRFYAVDKIPMPSVDTVSMTASGAARHKKSRRKKSNADKDIKLRAKVYVKHTVTNIWDT
jgi:hypothetical protein